MSDQLDDWGDSLDDVDGEFWESHFGGLDDSEIERMQGHSTVFDRLECEDSFEEENFDGTPFDDFSPDDNDLYSDDLHSLDDKKYILQWIVGSSLAKEMASSQGYVICGEKYVELESGGVCRVFDWFQEKGFKDNEKVGDYFIKFGQGFDYEKLILIHKIATKAPF